MSLQFSPITNSRVAANRLGAAADDFDSAAEELREIVDNLDEQTEPQNVVALIESAEDRIVDATRMLDTVKTWYER